VSRFFAEGATAERESEVVLLDLDTVDFANIHNGGALHFGVDGKLYVGVGDHGRGSNAQSLTNLLGKILRINADGSIPGDNPFQDPRTGQKSAIWALGLRNPFTFAINRINGRMLINDVGLSTWEEINDGVPGANYGWPNLEGPGSNGAYRNPVFSYPHSVGGTGVTDCAITGGIFYTPDVKNFPTNFIGSYFFGDWCSGAIRRLTPGGVVSNFIGGADLIVDLKIGPDGALYVLNRQSFLLTGSVVRFSWTDPVRLQIASMSEANSTQLTAYGRADHTYILDASSDLIHWASIATNATSVGTVKFSENGVTNNSQRFYRVRE
jgi:glucose/arabinose dehydrogenase